MESKWKRVKDCDLSPCQRWYSETEGFLYCFYPYVSIHMKDPWGHSPFFPCDEFNICLRSGFTTKLRHLAVLQALLSQNTLACLFSTE